MAMPIPVVNIVADFCNHGKKGLHLAQMVILLNMIVQTLLYMLNLADFPQMLLATHLILVFALICIVYALIRECKSREARFTNDILFAIFVLVLFGLVALADFYVSGNQQQQQSVLSLGHHHFCPPSDCGQHQENGRISGRVGAESCSANWLSRTL